MLNVVGRIVLKYNSKVIAGPVVLSDQIVILRQNLVSNLLGRRIAVIGPRLPDSY
jgi:hypothetical protein